MLLMGVGIYKILPCAPLSCSAQHSSDLFCSRCLTLVTQKRGGSGSEQPSHLDISSLAQCSCFPWGARAGGTQEKLPGTPEDPVGAGLVPWNEQPLAHHCLSQGS